MTWLSRGCEWGPTRRAAVCTYRAIIVNDVIQVANNVRMAQGLEDSNLVPESSFLIGISVHQSLHSNKQPMPASLVHLDIKRTSAVCVSAKKLYLSCCGRRVPFNFSQALPYQGRLAVRLRFHAILGEGTSETARAIRGQHFSPCQNHPCRAVSGPQSYLPQI